MSTDTVRPTKKQREILDFIQQFIGEHGYSPSYREIMNGLQYTSVATVSLHVNSLIRRGHLRKRDRSARSLEVVTNTDKPIEPQAVLPNEEKWLIDKVDDQFRKLELEPAPGQPAIDELNVLVGALRVLGLDGAALSFVSRLTDISKKSAK